MHENPDSSEFDEIVIRRNQDIEQAIRCLRLSPDGAHIACGDWHGNIRVYNLQSPTLDEIKCIEAHENEVLSIDFAPQFQEPSRPTITSDNSTT
jgi:WD40 repeat protein